MENNSWDVILTRSEAIAPFPRLEGAATCLSKAGLRCLAIGWDREARHAATQKGEGFDIMRAQFRGKYGGGIQNLYGILRWSLWLFHVHCKLRPKVIHAYDFDTIIPALIARSFIKCKVVYDIADWYAASRRVGWLGPLLARAERLACRKADLVIIAHEARLQQIGFVPQKLLVLYNVPQDRYEVVSQAGRHDYFVYVGVLQPDRGLKQIITSVSNLGVKLIIGGFGPEEIYCKTMASMQENIEFLGKIPYEQTLKLEASALAILALYDPAWPNNRLAAPNKLYEAMMLGRPLITTRETLVGQFVEQEKIGIAVTYGDIQELTEALKRLRDNPEEGEEMGRRARTLYETRYSFSKQCEKLIEAYRELCPTCF